MYYTYVFISFPIFFIGSAIVLFPDDVFLFYLKTLSKGERCWKKYIQPLFSSNNNNNNPEQEPEQKQAPLIKYSKHGIVVTLPSIKIRQYLQPIQNTNICSILCTIDNDANDMIEIELVCSEGHSCATNGLCLNRSFIQHYIHHHHPNIEFNETTGYHIQIYDTEGKCHDVPPNRMVQLTEKKFNIICE